MSENNGNVMFGKPIDPENRKTVGEGIGLGIKAGKNKRRIAIAALTLEETANLYRAEALLRKAERAADKLLVEGARRQGIEWTQKIKKLKKKSEDEE